MDKCIAFVLGGGGSRGALQVGALRALFEAGYQPDLLVGTSIGAVNATGLALWGTNLDGISALQQAYQKMEDERIMDQNFGRLTVKALSGRPNQQGSQRIVDLAVSMGLTADLAFDQLSHARLAMVGSDLNSGKPVIFGIDPSQSVLEGLLASVALPPWFAPVEENGRFVIDGSIVSNLPIEPALELGATEIFALDLMSDPTALNENITGTKHVMDKIILTVLQRQIYLETALASRQGVPVHYLQLWSKPAVDIWDFSQYHKLIRAGYQITRREIAAWSSM